MNLVEAAAFLGVSARTMGKLRKLGVVKGFWIPGLRIPRGAWRVRIEELLGLICSGWKPYSRLIDPQLANEMPTCMVAKLAGVSHRAVFLAKHRGQLKDYTFDAVHRWILRRERRRLRVQERKKLIEKYEKRLAVLRAAVSRLRRENG